MRAKLAVLVLLLNSVTADDLGSDSLIDSWFIEIYSAEQEIESLVRPPTSQPLTMY